MHIFISNRIESHYTYVSGGVYLKIDLTCPIEIRGYELTCDEEGGARAYIRMNNLAAHPISRFDAVACWSNSQTGQSEAQTFRVDQLDADARSEFPFTLAAFAVPHADTVDIHFNRVRFADGTADWIGGQAETIDIDELPLLSEEESDLLCDIAGDDAVRFSELHEKHWVCVCGRANYLHHETCSRCGRERDEVLNQCSRENILSRKTVRPYAAENDSL